MIKMTEANFEFVFNPELDEFGSWKHYETYGEDLSYISKLDDKYVWTVCEVDGNGYLVNGAVRVNRLYYVVCKEPCNLDDNSIQIKLWTEKELSI